MRLTDTDDQDQDMVRCRVESSRHFYSNLQKISTLQKILLHLTTPQPQPRLTARSHKYIHIWTRGEDNNSFTTSPASKKILKYFKNKTTKQ